MYSVQSHAYLLCLNVYCSCFICFPKRSIQYIQCSVKANFQLHAKHVLLSETWHDDLGYIGPPSPYKEFWNYCWLSVIVDLCFGGQIINSLNPQPGRHPVYRDARESLLLSIVPFALPLRLRVDRNDITETVTKIRNTLLDGFFFVLFCRFNPILIMYLIGRILLWNFCNV